MVEIITTELGLDSVAICAPTGSAAVNIHVNTIHAEFKLCIDANYTEPLSGAKANRLEMETKNLRFVLIDEMSMIGAWRFWQLNRRLRECNPNTDEPSGGLNIYFIGDFCQLPPVKDTAWYASSSKYQNGNKGLALFRTISTCIEVTCTYRQTKDLQFEQMADRIGRGQIIEQDYKQWAARDYNILLSIQQHDFDDAYYICALNNRVRAANLSHIEKLVNPIAKLISISVPNNQLLAYEKDSAGLLAILYPTVGSRLMLTKNIWTKAGLVNGAVGTVTAIVYDENIEPPSLPMYVLVEFEKYYGPVLFEDPVPIMEA